jgi:acetyl esterase/lipase
MAADTNNLTDIVYARPAGVELRLDVHLPPESAGKGPWPVVISIPGGGWRNCNKATPVPRWLVPRGIATVCIEYRKTPQFTAPSNVHDCKAAVRWVRANAARYNLDPARIGAWGSSAGGHLAAMLGATSHTTAYDGVADNPEHGDQPSHVKSVCDYCGPSDLTRFANPGWRVSWSLLDDVTRAYCGGLVSDRLDTARFVSPLHQITPKHTPILIVHGDADNVVPSIESVEYEAALRKAGIDVELRIAHGVGHGVHSMPSHQFVGDFFDRTLNG